MPHPREIIRKTVQDILLNGDTLAGKNIFMNKMIHPQSDCLPAVIIYTMSESIEELDQAPRRQKRELQLQLEVLSAVDRESPNNDQLDQLTWQIEILLADDDDWNKTINRQELSQVRMEFREQGDRPIGAALMTYDVEYITTLPESIISQQVGNVTDFGGIDLVTKLGVDYGIDLVGMPGSPQPGDPDNEVEKQFIIE